MGYYSKVIIGVKEGDLSNEFDDILKKHDFRPKKSNDYLKIDDVDGMKTYTFDYIKWYDNDDWCKEIMDYLHEASEDNDNAFCVAVGEDGTTHSEIGVHWDYVNRIIDIELTHKRHD